MIYAIVTVLVLILDQAVKYWTTKNIILDAVGADCKPLLDGVVHMTNVHNYGAAFGILQNSRWLLAVIAALFVVLIIVLISHEVIHTSFGRWTAVLVMAGALGNCIDRVLYGYVVDMFEVEFMHFAVFNVADIFITVCGILFCIHLIFYREPEAVKAANEPEFMRRRRAEKAEKAKAAAKEDPYANIPKRGEHKTLEEELAAADPDDPFAEWTFGSTVESPAPMPAKAPAPEPERRPAAKPAAAPEPEPAPEPAALEPETAPDRDLDYSIEDYSLEDILSEFGDF